MEDDLIKSKERVKTFGEVYTPKKLVKKVLNNIEDEFWNKGKIFFEPSCGNGNFLIEILIKKVKISNDILLSLSEIYGVDILYDNVLEARKRMLKTCFDLGLNKSDDLTKAVVILKENIFVGDFLSIEKQKNEL